MRELCLQKKSRSRMPWKPPDTTLSNDCDDVRRPMTLSAKLAKKHFTINVQKRPGSDFVYGYCIGGWILLKSLLIFFSFGCCHCYHNCWHDWISLRYLLITDTRLYTLPRWLVDTSVGRSVHPSVTFLNCEWFSHNKLHYCSCPT